MASEQAQSPEQCPVIFCGTPTFSETFDQFFEAAGKSGSFAAHQVMILGDAVERARDFSHGVLVILLPTPSDLQAVLAALGELRPSIEAGLFRVMVYCLLRHEKIPGILKQKGANEIVGDGLSLKALVHKLQRHVQIVLTQRRIAGSSDSLSLKTTSRPFEPEGSIASGARVRFVPAVEHENDCWLLKSKRDFRHLRGEWLGEVIGPGPSAGSWVEEAPAGFRWVPAEAEADPFVPGPGAWLATGARVEFVPHLNRWRFSGPSPELRFVPAGGGSPVYRFRCTAPDAMEVGLNSSVARAKLPAIIATFSRPAREEVAWGAADFAALTRGDRKWGWQDIKRDARKQRGAGPEPTADGASRTDGGEAAVRGGGFETDQEPERWASGADAFERIQLNVALKRLGAPQARPFGDVTILERTESEVLLDVPDSGFSPGERLSFSLGLAQKGSKRSLEITGTLKSVEAAGEGRQAIRVAVDEGASEGLAELQSVFDAKQEELLQFLKEAKGDV